MIDQFRVILARLRAEDAAMTKAPWVLSSEGTVVSLPDDVCVGALDIAVDNNLIIPIRNRNARLLDLLEALVEERDMRLYGLEELDFFDKCYAAQERTDAALAAFVEAEQGVLGD